MGRRAKGEGSLYKTIQKQKRPNAIPHQSQYDVIMNPWNIGLMYQFAIPNMFTNIGKS